MLKVAIVHEWFSGEGGSEKVVKALHEIFPEAPVYVLVYDKNSMPKEYNDMDVRTSWLQKIPFSKKKYQNLLPLMPNAVEQYDLSEFDLVLSSSTCCAKGVLTKANTIHICYCHTPMRYAWDLYHDYKKSKNKIMQLIIAWQMKGIRQWDRLSADRVDFFIANSSYVGKRIFKTYRRDSEVIFPPVNTTFYTPGDEQGDYYYIVSRLVSYKRIDIAVQAFNDLGLPLIITGGGPELAKYKKMAKSNIIFTGKVTDDEVRDYYRGCKAFIFPGEEDFGITPVEAQACGKPVLAFGKGGALETVIEGKTGMFFYQQNKEELKDVILQFEEKKISFDKEFIRKHAETFSNEVFKMKINKFISSKVKFKE